MITFTSLPTFCTCFSGSNIDRYGLELFDGTVQDNVTAGILEPTLSKLKSLKSATEAAIAIMRIDDFISLNPKAEPQHDGHDH